MFQFVYKLVSILNITLMQFGQGINERIYELGYSIRLTPAVRDDRSAGGNFMWDRPVLRTLMNLR